MKEDKKLTISMVADRLDVTVQTVYNLRKAGKLNVIVTGVTTGYVVMESELDRHMQESGYYMSSSESEQNIKKLFK